MIDVASWNKDEVHSIVVKGKRSFVDRVVDNLIVDFNEPKFGYNGELWDE